MEKGILQLISKLHFISSKLHIFHWNVTGKDFLSYHEFFEEAYKELLEQKDKMAEYLRFSSKKADIDFKAVLEMAKGFKIPSKAEDMLKDALKDYNSLLKDYEALKKEPVLEAIVSDILQELEKKIYFIQSILN
jgi:starvation-inducible DNA-binding protein